MNGKKWTNEDINFTIENYEENGVKFVAKKLNRTNSSVTKYCNTILGLTSQKEHNFIEKNTLIEKMKISHSYRELLINLDKIVNGQNLKILKKYINKYDIPNGVFVLKIDRTNRKTKSIQEWLQSGTTIGSSKLKDKLYRKGLKERICEKCGQDEYWNGDKMSLILDHINGINDDNRLENLRILCPNCNATLDTHCRGHKRLKIQKLKENNKIEYKKTKEKKIKFGHLKQRKVERPLYRQLINEINELGYCGVGRKYSVSDNTIRKWKKYYEK